MITAKPQEGSARERQRSQKRGSCREPGGVGGHRANGKKGLGRRGERDNGSHQAPTLCQTVLPIPDLHASLNPYNGMGFVLIAPILQIEMET